MKRCPDLKYEFVFLQMSLVLRNHLETCFGRKVKDTLVYYIKPKLDSYNASHFVWLLQARFERLYCKYNRA